MLQAVSGLLWSGLAVLNGTLAETKNERYWKWFLLSLPLGPLASVLILTRPVVPPPPEDRLTKPPRHLG